MNKHIERAGSGMFLLICILIVLSVAAMSVQRARELASSDRCRDNLRRLGIGLQNYHMAYDTMPAGAGGTTGGYGFPRQLSGEKDSNRGRLSGFAALLPFIDQSAAYSKLKGNRTGSFPPMGPVPSYDPSEYTLWSVQFDAFLCPSDPAVKEDYGMRSYVMNYGDAVDSVGRLFDDSAEDQVLRREVGRGAFVPHASIRNRDFLDGLSNTVMLSETMIGVGTEKSGAMVVRGVPGLIQSPGNALKTATASQEPYRPGQIIWSVGKGSRWAEGSFLVNAFTTVLPPNGPSATLPRDPESGCISPSSYHLDGVNVLMGNGAVRFVSNTIDVGDSNAASISPLLENGGEESPFGVWGAMGTRAGIEIIPSEREAAFQTYPGY
ncbi:DUF1559 domain-containing protein [Allorhodopirellula heiligendammensis]|uniref:DUF1559 domain-containing protein n=1 Tax=Allorhodopirellula heiligendammensis TaxID=2714739 RepID=A0A5C6C782_9BACT|nr:DUF1559 domain-containing protein [Allorhodopirellula heiligendammensis]TWU19174.1 hypothetical protein Poly21_13450 [Allorhodopirellula heiligendammensis]